mmetsp:Transcript_20985/g.57629  ORF Transcript_20985/g.57629 Transcript_20985/m.57629 type:complete len:139 (+) Transcript_20985:1150-1566(+)|eukprot:scaffold115941_cov28-Tisochrysis_lutea.AAC.1
MPAWFDVVRPFSDTEGSNLFEAFSNGISFPSLTCIARSLLRQRMPCGEQYSQFFRWDPPRYEGSILQPSADAPCHNVLSTTAGGCSSESIQSASQSGRTLSFGWEGIGRGALWLALVNAREAEVIDVPHEYEDSRLDE